ncbi:MAG: hypothetical protein ABID61_02150 [Candidatus Micrarchaeota archaeon]
MVEELLKPHEVGDSRGLVLFVLGVILGLGAMFSMFYFFGHCSGSESISALIGSGGSGNGSSGSSLGSGTTIFKDASGNILTVENGANGKTSTFVDSTGKRRGITCYTSVYCIEDCEDCNDTEIPCEDCNKENELCGSASSTATSYGDCCEDLECISGRCKPQCVQENNLCGYGPASTSPYNYGDCCGEYTCTDGYCKPPIEPCKQKGGSCGFTATDTTTSLGDCCGDLTCTNNVCTEQPQCGETGDPCTYDTAYATPGSLCCDDFVCQQANPGSANGFCQPKPCMTIGTCQLDGDCCEGYYCDSIFQCTKKCTGDGGTCSINGDCCAGRSCIDGSCQLPCESEGAFCSDTKPCCGTNTCVSGKCTETCTPTPLSCLSDNECCSGICKSGTCADCGYTYESCTDDEDCCQGFICNDGECDYSITTPSSDCYGIGYSCTSDGQCCGDNVCNDNGYCSLPDRPCVGAGYSCSADTCCSPLACGTSLTCINRPPPEPSVCQEYGEACDINGLQCCSPYQCDTSLGCQ